ncbi:NAD-dependent epimerase/dehydratase family protein [Catenovulum sediminis]|uniref:NAD-dependent epimerase/dehydratase family protein n=1 Tax=Catenovulum sediminis TaxID=1740262 RepID=UPI001180EE3D|nr:NAD(P)-dependent oxidoreductase [Catenovulum sediminis]
MLYISGASGYIGSALCKHLNKQSIQYNTIRIRIDEPESTGSLLQINKEDTLIHLGECANITQANQLGERYIQQNLAALKKLLFLGFNKIIYVSSTAVYGETGNTPAMEADSDLVSSHIYTRNKITCEQFIQKHFPEYVICRLSNVYGGTMKQDCLFADILNQLSAPTVTLRNTAHTRDYIHITDVCTAITQALKINVNGLYNISAGQSYSVSEIANQLFKIHNATPILKGHSTTTSSQYICNKKAMQALNWIPQMDISAGLKTIKVNSHE